MANLENERIIKNDVAPTGLSFVATPKRLLLTLGASENGYRPEDTKIASRIMATCHCSIASGCRFPPPRVGENRD
jgi:hypothetical protein